MTRRADTWRSLSPAYRARLIRNVGAGDPARARAAYLRGDSLAAARGKPAAEAAVRRERGQARGLSRTQAAGRPRPGEPAASAIGREFLHVPVRQPAGGPAGRRRYSREPASGTAVVDITARNAGAASRLGSYLHDVRELLAGRLDGASFAGRWKGRRVAGQRVEHDPARVREALRTAGPLPAPRKIRFVPPAPRREVATPP